jgi:hypothetical protein
MKLARHVGGLSQARKLNYLLARGWHEEDGGWRCPRRSENAWPLAKAIHHQLTEDLCLGLSPSGWTVESYSPRGYARLQDPKDSSLCSLPAALRRQARREQRPVAELTYVLFLAALAGVEDGQPQATATTPRRGLARLRFPSST